MANKSCGDRRLYIDGGQIWERNERWLLHFMHVRKLGMAEATLWVDAARITHKRNVASADAGVLPTRLAGLPKQKIRP